MADTNTAPIFAGWNVWAVWQVKDLPFSIMMLGVSRDRQLQIWVEDQTRVNGGASTADPIDLKGSSVQILNGAPTDLQVAVRKESVSGPTMTVEGDAELRYVRFYNRGDATSLPWPHDESYLLDSVYEPSKTSPTTNSAPPPTIGQTVGGGLASPIVDAGKSFIDAIPAPVLWGAVILSGLALFTPVTTYAKSVSKKASKTFREVKRKISS